MDRNLVDAAQDLGCTWMQAFWKVIIPEIKPGIISGALTAFTMSIDDFIISYFTAGTSASTLAMTIYGMTKKRVSPEINAISTLLFVTVILLLAIACAVYVIVNRPRVKAAVEHFNILNAELEECRVRNSKPSDAPSVDELIEEHERKKQERREKRLR